MKSQWILVLFALLVLTGFFSSISSDYQEVKHQITIAFQGE